MAPTFLKKTPEHFIIYCNPHRSSVFVIQIYISQFLWQKEWPQVPEMLPSGFHEGLWIFSVEEVAEKVLPFDETQ